MRMRRVHSVELNGQRCVVDLTPRRSVTKVAVQAARLALDHGVPVARLIGSDFSRRGLLRYGTSYAMYEYVRGRHPEYVCGHEDLRSIAQTYGQLHAVSKDETQAMCCVRIRDYVEKWDRAIRQFSAASQVSHWLHEAAPAEKDEELYLNHGDANRGNSIVNSDGRTILIDLGTAHFGCSLFEFIYLMLNYTQNDLKRREVFMDAYFDQNPAMHPEWQERSAFFLVGGLLERLCWRVESARAWQRRGRHDQARLRQHSISEGFDRVLELTRLFSGDRSEFTKVMSECWE